MTPHERMGHVYREARQVDPTGRLGDALWLAALDGGPDPARRAERMEQLWTRVQSAACRRRRRGRPDGRE